MNFKNHTLIEFLNITYDLRTNDTVKKMKKFNQHANTSCYTHCLQVAFYTYLICKKFNLDYVSATRGAMLHDLFLYDWHCYIKRDNKWNSHHAFLHPKIALKNATKLFELNEIEQDIILNHMWPVTIQFPHYFETYIVTFTDKYSACRETYFNLINSLHKKTLYKYAYVFLAFTIFRII